MSVTVEARIAETLALHQLRRFGHCTCPWSAGVDTDWEAEHVAHQAAVLANHPDIAIIELPEGESNWHTTDWDGGRVSLCYGVDTVRCYLPNPALEVAEAEQLGIALIAASRALAAARAAGGDT